MQRYNVVVWHNIATDYQGRPLGMVEGYNYWHALTPVAFLKVNTDDRDRTCGDLWRLLNVGDDPSFGKPDPEAVAYRERKNRSLSVGDVLMFVPEDGRSFWYSVDSIGFSELATAPLSMTRATAHGSTAIELPSRLDPRRDWATVVADTYNENLRETE